MSCKVETLDAHVEEVILGMLTIDDVGRYISDDTEDVAELARRRDGLQARLDELGRMFATGDIDASQLRSGSAELHSQLAGINSLLASLLRTSPAANLLNGDGDLRERWDATSAEMKGRIIDELTGQPVDAFGHVVVKELLDNALDAAESAGRGTDHRHHHPHRRITGSHSSPSPTTAAVSRRPRVDDVCDFTVLVSDKARYRGPARGAQGNALKTLLGIPYALGITKPVVIKSAGIHHELLVSIERTGDVAVVHDTTAVQPHSGHIGDGAAARGDGRRSRAVGRRRRSCKPARRHQRD